MRTSLKVHITERGEGMKLLERRIKALATSRAHIGVFADSADMIGPHNNDEVLSMAQIAAVHEFGVTGRIPERSFMRSTLEKNSAKYTELLKKMVDLVLLGKISAKTAISRVGAIAASDMQATIVNGLKPALSKRTLLLRAKNLKKRREENGGKDPRLRDGRGRFFSTTKSGFKPLFDSGQLVRAITYKAIMRGVEL
jgi:hypothetical protein